MPDNTKIRWATTTWNPFTGCDKVSPGCAHCYAERMTKRFPEKFPTQFNLTFRPERLSQLARWRNPRRIFVCSMSDIFHEDIPFDDLRRVWDAMLDMPQHTYMMLTKRARHLEEIAHKLEWPDNFWMGVSVENWRYLWRIPPLRQVPVRVKFLSLEPLLGSLFQPNLPQLDLDGIRWVITGGESGPGYRPMELDWVREIRDACQARRIPFFYKQAAGYRPEQDHILDGEEWSELPSPKERLL